MRSLLWVFLLLVACEEEVDDFCEEVPVVTWDNFGADHMRHNCQTCHASTTADRHGAPLVVTFDTYEEVMGRKQRILEVAGGESPLMPPSGGVSAEDQWKLEVWLRCFE